MKFYLLQLSCHICLIFPGGRTGGSEFEVSPWYFDNLLHDASEQQRQAGHRSGGGVQADVGHTRRFFNNTSSAHCQGWCYLILKPTFWFVNLAYGR